MVDQQNKIHFRIIGVFVALASTLAVGAHFRLGFLAMPWPIFWDNFTGLLVAFFLVSLVGSFVFEYIASRFFHDSGNLGFFLHVHI